MKISEGKVMSYEKSQEIEYYSAHLKNWITRLIFIDSLKRVYEWVKDKAILISFSSHRYHGIFF